MRIQTVSNLDIPKNQDRTVSLRRLNPKNQPDNLNFKGNFFKVSEKTKKAFYTSKSFKQFAKMSSNPVLLDATIVLGLTCLLRPLTIVSMPGAEKRDKQYAAAHSIASGLWGFSTALVVFSPINNAVKNVLKKVNEKPEYLKNSFLKHNQKNKDSFNFVASYGPKLFLQPLVAAGTIAFIPLLMGLFFNNHKKINDKNKTQKIKNLEQQNPPKQFSFKGANPEKSISVFERMNNYLVKK